ncbi:MAG: hypothetical protein CSB34_07140 [Desulfobulbus propionicus]|nr:MAG: hypothetical protein CSB34_07140 [Desulfobulbus propionicus]PIE66572.1 MAG: hypothetical protein CSA26_00275 [Desulfobacterales bacterium]
MKTLLLLGDSLVEWGEWDTLLPNYKTINRGMAGETTEGLAGRLPPELIGHANPDGVILHSGTNNLLLGFPHFPSVYSSMLPIIRDFYTSCPIIVCSLFPMSIVSPLELEQVNNQLQEVTEQVENCHFLDMVVPFNMYCLPITKPGFLNDQVHLSTHGYQVWAQTIDTFLQQLGI